MPAPFLDASVGAFAALAVPMLALGLNGSPGDRSSLPAAETVLIAAQVLDFPAPGEFLVDGKPAPAPVTREDVPAFRIMKRQVSVAEYARCVAAGACADVGAHPAGGDVPVTGVSWLDVDAYVRWYSQVTGETWRLPTALEAAAAAGERFDGESFSAAADDPANPAVRWIRRYREEAAAKRPADPAPKPGGYYGANTLGVEDFAGNVWEWTSTCYSRATLGAAGVESVVENCGVHVLEGRHRAYMSNFVREGKSGGCAVGTPPENLGFRLVLDERPCGLACWIGRFFPDGSVSS